MILTCQPSLWEPKQWSDIIGPAAQMGQIMRAKAARLRDQDNAVFKHLFYGPPGCGKTSLANLLGDDIAGDDLAVERYSGLDVTIDTVRQWQSSLGMAGLFGNFQVKVVHEMDRVPAAAQDRMLEYLDKLPGKTAFIGTSNLQIDLLQERFQTRLQTHKIAGPSEAEIVALIQRWGIDSATAAEIAFACGGNARAALLDTESVLDMKFAVAA